MTNKVKISTSFGQRALAQSSVVSAVSSIELFNRPRAKDRIALSLISNVRAWELLAKAVLLKNKVKVFTSDGKSLSASKSIKMLDARFNVITPGEQKTIQQIISLRDEVTHSVLDSIPDDLAAHLLYFSLKSFKVLLQKHYPAYAKELNANFISVNFEPTYTYAAKIQSMLNSKKALVDDRLLFALERGLNNAESDEELTESGWVAKVKSLKGKRLTKGALLLKKYASEHDNVFFITVEAPSKFGKADVTLSKGRHGAKTKITVVSSDPEETHPYLTSELEAQINVGRNIILKKIKELGLKGNKDYHLEIRTGKTSVTQRYSELAKQKIIDSL